MIIHKNTYDRISNNIEYSHMLNQLCELHESHKTIEMIVMTADDQTHVIFEEKWNDDIIRIHAEYLEKKITKLYYELFCKIEACPVSYLPEDIQELLREEF